MSPRPRKKGRRDLPTNLYPSDRDRVTYYRYRHPQTGTWHGLGSDKAKAVEAARILNSKLMAPGASAEKLASRIIAGPDTVRVIFERFVATLAARRDNKGRAMAEKTRRSYVGMLSAAADDFGHLGVADVTRRHIAEHLNSYPARSSNARRNVLQQAFRYAYTQGLTEHNPVEGTDARAEVVERRRLKLEHFQAIQAEAPAWYSHALDLALKTLQRRGDLTRMRFDHIDDGHLLVRQQKERGTETANVRIRVGPELGAVIDSCRDDVLSPFMVHCAPRRKRREYIAQKEHWTQVAPEKLTREFARIRDDLGIESALPSRQRPSFHEIRALGADLYRQAGWPEDAIQRLLGHASQAQTKVYLDRHREVWVDAEAG